MTKRKSLGEFLSKALARPGATQAGLARDLGVTRSTVHLWVKGKRTPPENYRAALRNAAHGRTVTAPPPPTTKAGTVRRTRGSVTRKSVGGKTHIKARALSTFASELSTLAAAGQHISGLSVTLAAFRGSGSDPGLGRTRRLEIGTLSPAEMSDLARGGRGALEDLIKNTIQSERYTGGFTYDRATGFDFQI